MAGNYPDVPNNRIPYDRDGTVVFSLFSANVVSELSNSILVNMNDESSGNEVWTNYGSNGTTRLGLVFPRLMDITGIWMSFNPATGTPSPSFMEQSVNTTNGYDGTWTSVSGYAEGSTVLIPSYRNNISAISANAVRAVRVGASMPSGWHCYFSMLHLYGKPTAGQDENRVEFWHPTLDQRVGAAYFDWGNVPRLNTNTITFRVKNRSSTLTANNVVLTFSEPTPASPTQAGQHSMSDDAVNFFSTRTITSLAPGAISSVYTLKRVTVTNAALSLWTMRMLATVTTWT